MATYCTLSDIQAYIDQIQLVALTDDFATGNIDTNVLNNIISISSNKAYSLVSSIYAPFVSPPSKIREATIIFSCFALWARRATPDEKNPFKPQQDYWIDALTKINAGQLSLDESFNRGVAPIVASTSKTRIDTSFY